MFPHRNVRAVAFYAAQASASHEFFDGINHVFHIDDQRRRTVGSERGRRYVLDFSKARIKRLHDQFLFAEETVHDESIVLRAVAEHYHGHFVMGFSFAAIENLMRRDKADALVVEREMLPAFQRLDFFPRQF